MKALSAPITRNRGSKGLDLSQGPLPGTKTPRKPI